MQRLRWPLQGKSVEHFLPGRPGGLKSLLEVTGRRREVDFYSHARQDGLFRREETHAAKVASSSCQVKSILFFLNIYFVYIYFYIL